MDIFDNVDPEWMEFFKSKKVQPILHECLKKLGECNMKDICPNPGNIFRVFKISPKKIRVVILGQDPYHGVDQACGFSFSVNLGLKIPPSLNNVYKCLLNYNLIKKRPTHGCLNNWALQGVFMLNASLTTLRGKPGSHPWWHEFTDLVIEYLATTYREQIIYLLWGKDACSKISIIDSDSNVVLESHHPSPMADANVANEDRFINCNHFEFVNEILDSNPIDWNPTTITGIFTDGSCPNNGKADAPAGWGVYITSGPLAGTKKYGAVASYTDSDGNIIKRTNVRAELTAIIEALDIYLEHQIIGNLYMYIDNEMCVKIINEWLDKWIRENRIDDMKNPDLIHLLKARLQKLRNIQTLGGFTFKAIHIYSHLEKKGKKPEKGTKEYKLWKANHEVDKLANLGADLCKFEMKNSN